MKRYSVAMVAACPFPANYGTPGAIREMSETLASFGHDVHVVTYPFGEDLPVGAAKVWRAPYWRKSRNLYTGPSFEKLLLDVLLLVQLCRVIRRQRVSIIHAHNYEGVLIGFVAKLLTRRPLLYNAVSLMSDELPSYKFLRPAFLARALARFLDWLAVSVPDYFIAITRELHDFFLSRQVPEDRIALIPCGVKPEMFDRPKPEVLRARYDIRQRPVIMYTGVNSPFQRIDYLLQAFALVLKAEPTAVLMVVSPLKTDPDLAANQTLAEAMHISASIIWVQGQTLAELPDYLAMASVAVISRPNVPGHPIKLLNYMAAARPIVCFAGAAKGVRHLHDAYVVADTDVTELSRGIVTLLRDGELASRLGAAARDTVVRDFDWRRLCGDVETIYKLMDNSESPLFASAVCRRLTEAGTTLVTNDGEKGPGALGHAPRIVVGVAGEDEQQSVVTRNNCGVVK
jgi:glycosyltransferase involved in cell wall biosynthesis